MLASDFRVVVAYLDVLKSLISPIIENLLNIHYKRPALNPALGVAVVLSFARCQAVPEIAH